MGSSQYLYNAKMREEIVEQLGVTPTPGGLQKLLEQHETDRLNSDSEDYSLGSLYDESIESMEGAGIGRILPTKYNPAAQGVAGISALISKIMMDGSMDKFNELGDPEDINFSPTGMADGGLADLLNQDDGFGDEESYQRALEEQAMIFAKSSPNKADYEEALDNMAMNIAGGHRLEKSDVIQDLEQAIAERRVIEGTPDGLSFRDRFKEKFGMEGGGIVHLADGGDLVGSRPMVDPLSGSALNQFNTQMSNFNPYPVGMEKITGYSGISSQGRADARAIADAVANRARLSEMGKRSLQPYTDPVRQSTGSLMKEFGKNAIMSGIMSDPKLKEKFMLTQAFGRGGTKGLSKALGQKAGIEALFNKVGPWGMLMPNQGGPLGLGIMGSNRSNIQKIMQGLFDPRVANRIKFAQMFPGIAATGMIMNKFSPRIEGQTGAVGQGLGPQLANIGANIFGTRTHAEAERDLGVGFMGGTLGPRIKNLLGLSVDKNLDRRNLNRDRLHLNPLSSGGIFGGTVGPRLRDIFTRNRDESPIQEIEVTAQKRLTEAQKRNAAFDRDIAMQDERLRDRLAETSSAPTVTTIMAPSYFTKSGRYEPGRSENTIIGGGQRMANEDRRAANWARSGPHRKLAQKIASGQMPVRKISSYGGRK